MKVETTLKLGCSRCGAAPGEPCVSPPFITIHGRKYERPPRQLKRVHSERIANTAETMLNPARKLAEAAFTDACALPCPYCQEAAHSPCRKMTQPAETDQGWERVEQGTGQVMTRVHSARWGFATLAALFEVSAAETGLLAEVFV